MEFDAAISVTNRELKQPYIIQVSIHILLEPSNRSRVWLKAIELRLWTEPQKTLAIGPVIAADVQDDRIWLSNK